MVHFTMLQLVASDGRTSPHHLPNSSMHDYFAFLHVPVQFMFSAVSDSARLRMMLHSLSSLTPLLHDAH